MKFLNVIKSALTDAVRASLALFKIMIPVLIAIKILKELGVIAYLAVPLAPVMELVGLPAQSGLIWAMAMANSLYAAFAVYVSLMPDLGVLSVAQVTVLGTMMLIAHSLPVECRITQKCGLSFRGQVMIRISSAFLCGMLMHFCFSSLDILGEPAQVVVLGKTEDGSLGAWAWGLVQNLGSIFVVILCLMSIIRILNYLHITDLFIKLLGPVLRAIGIGKEAGAITIIGLTMGITYGGGLIIHEAQGDRLSRADVFSSVTLMGLSHGLIDDTALMMLMGASIYGVLWGRLAFSLVLMAIFTRFLTTRVMQRDTVWNRVFIRKGFLTAGPSGNGR